MTDFNQANWATITNSYFSSIKKTLSSPAKYNVIIDEAKSFLRATFQTGNTTVNTSAKQNVNEQAFLCDDPDSD